MEGAIVSSGPPKKADNASLLKSAMSSLHPQMMNKGRPLIDTNDSENPSLLTSIPTFAPPAAIKGRGEDRNDIGLNIPNPTISLGIPSLNIIRRYISDRLRDNQRRSPRARNEHPLPPASADAVPPHKAPVSDSTVIFVNNAEQNRNEELANWLKNNTDDNQTDRDNTTAQNLNNANGRAANNFKDATQDNASAETAVPNPLESETGGAPASGNGDPHSLSHSLGTITHAQFQKEDNGRKQRKRVDAGLERKFRKRKSDEDDDGSLKEKLGEYYVPTIWNGELDIDDLNWSEIQELDEWLDTLAYIQKHSRKVPPTNLSSTTRPAVKPRPGLTQTPSPSTVNDSSRSRPSTESTILPPPPKSLANALGLKSHQSFQNRTHRGHRRDKTLYGIADHDTAKRLEVFRSTNFRQLPPGPDGKLRNKREDAYDPNLEPVDISDEAYEEFRRKYPTFFGSGWRKEKRADVISNVQDNPGKRDPLSSSWFAMLLSPSALLEKSPASKISNSEKRDNANSY